MKLFDCHTHLERGRDGYDLRGVERWNVIFNSIESYQDHRRQVQKSDVVTLILDYKSALPFIAQELATKRVQALKIHARTQRIEEKDYSALEAGLASLKTRRPVIYDGFYYGDELRSQPSLDHVIRLAKRFPEIPFVIAHCGGYDVLKYFFHLRPLGNIYYDLSFSLQYLRDTSCFPDLAKLIRYTDKTRIMFGSDYPWASPKLQLGVLKQIFRKTKVRAIDQRRVLYENAARLFAYD